MAPTGDSSPAVANPLPSRPPLRPPLAQRALFPVRLIAQAEEELAASEAKEAEREAARERIAGLSGGGLPGQGKQSKEKERKRMRRVLEKVWIVCGGDGFLFLVCFFWGGGRGGGARARGAGRGC